MPCPPNCGTSRASKTQKFKGLHLRGPKTQKFKGLHVKILGAAGYAHQDPIKSSLFRERRIKITNLGPHAHCSRLQHHAQIGGRSLGGTGTQSQGWGHHMPCPPQLRHLRGLQNAKFTCKNPLLAGAIPRPHQNFIQKFIVLGAANKNHKFGAPCTLLSFAAPCADRRQSREAWGAPAPNLKVGGTICPAPPPTAAPQGPPKRKNFKVYM